MIAFDFDRAKMRRRLTTYSAILLGISAFMLLSGVLILSHVLARWVGWLALVLCYVVQMHVIDYARWIGGLIRGLKRNGVAFIVNKTGIVDNASDIAPGQLAWEEIEKMYPADWISRLIADRWRRMPVLSKERGIMVRLKDGADLQHCLADKPELIRRLTRRWYVSGRGRWLFIPETMLTATADEVMAQLNRFYNAEVRGTA